MKRSGWLALALISAIAIACTKVDPNKEIWIYTSLYKDTVADILPKLEQDFPGVNFHFYQAGSEEIAAKVNAEILAGGTKADILIASDRFWFEDLAKGGYLHPYKDARIELVPSELRNLQNYYSTLSIPVMVLAYNMEIYSATTAPKTFKELVQTQWRGKFSTGSPLASGTNFTTVAFLSNAYGWDYFKKLMDNKTISEGGNSSVLRRIQNKERPVGWVLLENILRLQDTDKRIKVVYPEDGVVIQNNVLAITKKNQERKKAEEVAAWLFSDKGQEAVVRSYMYSPIPGFKPPRGAPLFSELQKKAFRWTPEFLKHIVENRETIKEKFTEMMYY